MGESIADSDKISREWWCISILWKNGPGRWICITKGIYQIGLNNMTGYFNNGSPHTSEAENLVAAHSLWLGASGVLSDTEDLEDLRRAACFQSASEGRRSWALQSAKDVSTVQGEGQKHCPGDGGASVFLRNSLSLSCCRRVLEAVEKRVFFPQLFLPANRLSQSHIPQLILDAIKLTTRTNCDIL